MDLGKLWRTGPAPVSAPMGGPALSQGMFGGILSKLNPFPEGLDPNEHAARSDALIQLGLGILQGNQGNYGAVFPAIAAGGMAGFQGYKNALREQGDRRLRLLQEKLVGSQIAENDSQALLRKTKMDEEARLRQARVQLIDEMDKEWGDESEQGNRNYLSPTPTQPDAVTGDRVNVLPRHWSLTAEGNHAAAMKAQRAGLDGLAKEYLDRANELQRLKLERDKLAKDKEPAQKITVGAPTGGNEQWDYIYDPDKKAKGPRWDVDPRYVFAGKRQAVSNNIVNNIPAKAEEAYSKRFGDKIADTDSALYEAAQKAPEMAETANTVMKLLKEGKPITGWGASFRQGFASAAAAAGVKDESVADSQQLGQMLATTTMAAIKSSGLGAGQGFTNTDREFLEKAAAGQINFDEKSLYRAAQLNYKAALRARDKWKSRFKMMPKSAIEGTGVSADIEIPPQYSFTPKEQPKAAPPAGAPRFLRFDKNGDLIR